MFLVPKATVFSDSVTELTSVILVEVQMFGISLMNKVHGNMPQGKLF